MITKTVDPLVGIALIFAVGHIGGLLARRLHMPSVTGNILAGVLMGPSVLGFFTDQTARSLEPVNIFAMGLITAVIGGHLSYRRLHNAKRRILSVMACEVIFSASLVFAASWFISGGNLGVSLILAAISTATAPATVLAVFREERAKGLTVKTALASVALDNVICILLFTGAMAWVAHDIAPGKATYAWAMFAVVRDMALSALLGGAVGGALMFSVRTRALKPFAGLLFAVLVCIGGAGMLGFSPLLTCLAMGLTLGNSGRENEELISALEDLEPMVLTCFFTLAGVELHLHTLPAMGGLGAAYILARGAGKVTGGYVGGWLGGAPGRVRAGLGPTLLPQAGLAIGLLVVLQGDARFDDALVELVTNVVLAGVVFKELLGPPLVRRAIRKAEESGKDRRRIVEFLQEEHILYPLNADDRWEAIRTLGDFLIRTHGVRDVNLDELVESVETRERQVSTAIGSGVALPHARVEGGPEIMGVMGICPHGIDFDAPDGEDVRVIILIATPEGHEDRHLEVLAAVAGLMSDPEVRAHLLTARSAAEAYEVLESGSRQDYNYFLDEA